VSKERLFPAMQIVRLGGDSLYRSDWELFTERFPEHCVFMNFYGGSEMSTSACFYMDAQSQLPDGVLPVGFALDDVEISVVDGDGMETRVESSGSLSAALGEIVLKSPYLSPGYWNNADATNVAFDVIDASTGTRRYKTGDLGTIRQGQGLVHAGRGDSQVKISGFRVEIAEVESCLRNCPGVKDAAIVMHSPEQGERELIGFVTMRSADARTSTQVRSYLGDRLPPHMVPSQIIAIERIPITPNGKIDRAALGRIREEQWKNRKQSAPRTHTEEVLLEVWKYALSQDHIGVEDDFFALGGNSLLGMKLVSRVVERFAIPLRVVTVFQNPTISRMAQVIDQLVSNSPQIMSGEAVVDEGVI
jgi:acyl-coenzyme A synthetase/AMP-(fatty) acid ligase